MPLGVSEKLIEKAYAPVDLGKLYGQLDAFAKRSYAESAAEKKQALKEYYTPSASLDKDLNSVKFEDQAELMQHRSNWKNAKLKLASSPNLIETNPKLYGELSNQVNESLNKLQEGISLSKATKARHIKDYDNIRNNPAKFLPGALTSFINATKKTSRQLIETGEDNPERYAYVGPPLKDVENITTNALKNSTIDADNLSYTNTKYGAILGEQHKIVSPEKAINFVDDKINQFDDRSAAYVLSNISDYDDVMKKYNETSEDKNKRLGGYKTFSGGEYKDMFTLHESPFEKGKMVRLPDLNPNPATDKEKLNNYYIAKTMLAINTPSVVKRIEIYPEGKEQQLKLAKEISLSFNKRMENFRQANKINFRETGIDVAARKSKAIFDAISLDKQAQDESKILFSNIVKSKLLEKQGLLKKGEKPFTMEDANDLNKVADAIYRLSSKKPGEENNFIDMDFLTPSTLDLNKADTQSENKGAEQSKKVKIFD